MNLKDTLGKVAGRRVLVVGDVMLDRYWWGSATRISPEAPVPVVALERETAVLGGAANVAANVLGLGAIPILVGVIGNDAEGELFRNRLEASGMSSDGMSVDASRPTTVKTRILAHNHQVSRVDREARNPLDEAIGEQLLESVCGNLESCDAVVLSDYAKGALTDIVLAKTIETANAAGKPVLVDPKGREFSKYRGAYLLTPNHKEAMDATSISDGSMEALSRACRGLIAALDLKALLVTRGENGMLLLRAGENDFSLGSSARDVYDVTGAGDTVIASLGCAIAGGIELTDAIRFANHAAGIVIEHLGTTAITRELLGH